MLLNEPLSRRRLLLSTGALFASRSPPAQATDEPGVPLQYYSDYVSFSGGDMTACTYLAIDTNRGRDGEAYQAEHFLASYVDGRGFVDLSGTGEYENSAKLLSNIPSSEYFKFTGRPETGLFIDSPANALRLSIDPVPRVFVIDRSDGYFWVGGAPAQLEWGGRSMAGRVIYEALHFNHWNRLTRSYPGMWKNFNSFYLLTGNSGDIYLHSHGSEKLAERIGSLVGFASWSHAEPMHQISFEITKFEWARFGLYSWPLAWRVEFSYDHKRFRLDLESRNSRTFYNWVIGGFRMAIVTGEIRAIDGVESIPVTGWGEMII